MREHRLELSEVLSLLREDGLITRQMERELEEKQRMRSQTMHPLVAIAEQQWQTQKDKRQLMSLEWLTEWLADKVNMDYFHIDPLKIDFSSVADVMSSSYASRCAILPLSANAKEVVVATAEPYISDWVRDLEPILRRPIRRVLANPLDIKRYLVEFFNLAKSVKRAAQNGAQVFGAAGFEQLVELGKGNRTFDANDQHIVHIVDWLWQYAFEQKASDIHIEPRRDIGIVRFRIDGVLHQVYQIPMAVMNAMTSRIKLLGRMDVIEKRRPQDGRIKTRLPDGLEVELRLSTLPTAFGEKLVMRVFDPEVLVRDFQALGFSSDDLSTWQGLTSQPHGIILVTGPTGSGKTTTLYSTLKQLATPEVNVCTIEDPIEMVESAFNQMQVQAGQELSFADGVRALMRQDPDIIMIGEIRDLETAEMAVQAALTGHLVLASLHTNDAPQAITRLMDLGIPSYLLNATLLGVMAQRLVRTLCPHCRQAIAPGEAEAMLWHELVTPWTAELPAQMYRPEGCLECRMTGYAGRVGVYEILRITPDIRRHISAEVKMEELRQMAYRQGMMPLRVAGAMKVAMGMTSLAEIVKVAPPHETH